jgi:hypothetical protein
MLRTAAALLALVFGSSPLAANAAAPTSVWLAFQHMNVHAVQAGCRLEQAGVVSCSKSVGTSATTYTSSSPSSGPSDGTCIIEVRVKSNPPAGGSPFSVSAMWTGSIKCAVTWTDDASVSVTFTKR